MVTMLVTHPSLLPIMPKIILPLTSTQIKNKKPSSKPTTLFDGLETGLHVLIQPNGTKTFRLKIQIDGKDRRLTLGTFPDMSLAEAREEAGKLKKQVKQGVEEGNPLALNEMREYLQLKASQSRVMLSDVVDRFSGAPWGWKPEWEIVLLIARLFMAGEIKLVSDNSDLEPSSAIEPLTKAARFKQVSILKRKSADAVQLTRRKNSG